MQFMNLEANSTFTNFTGHLDIMLDTNNHNAFANGFMMQVTYNKTVKLQTS